MALISQLAIQVLKALGIGAGIGAGAAIVSGDQGTGGDFFGPSSLLPAVNLPFFGAPGAGFSIGERGRHGRRPRRRQALSQNDLRIMLTIAASVSKKAAETFIAQRTRPG